MSDHADVLIVGAGPAGIAAAIAASRKNLRTVVVDARTPPINKPCGEGILPQGIAALHALGVHLTADTAVPFCGIRFADEKSSASATFRNTNGFALRRTRLHQLLVEHAVAAGVRFHWGTRITDWTTDLGLQHVTAGENRIHYRWLVGADGQNSLVRQWAMLDPKRGSRKRFGFRQHFRIRPWTNLVEVYWGRGCEMFITPTAADEVGVAVFSRDPRLRLDQSFAFFPALAEKLKGATPVSAESGDATSFVRLPAVTRGHVALVGDASGSVDAVTGYGLTLSFQHALHLADAFERNDLSIYESAHRKMERLPAYMTRLMLTMDASPWIRCRALKAFERFPELFSSLLAVHTGDSSASLLRGRSVMDWGPDTVEGSADAG